MAFVAWEDDSNVCVYVCVCVLRVLDEERNLKILVYSSENSGSRKRGKDAVHYSLVFIGCGARYVIAGPNHDTVIECGRRRRWYEHYTYKFKNGVFVDFFRRGVRKT